MALTRRQTSSLYERISDVHARIQASKVSLRYEPSPSPTMTASQAIASGDCVYIYDADLQPVETLRFSDAFPTSTSDGDVISAVAVDGDGERIAAASYGRIAVWQRTSASHYRVHSSVASAERVSSIAISGDVLVTASSKLTVWTLENEFGFPMWRQSGSAGLPDDVVCTALSPDCRYLACSFGHNQTAYVYRLSASTEGLASLSLLCRPWHPTHIRRIQWLSLLLADAETSLLSVETDDGVVRLWGTMPDEPDFFVSMSASASDGEALSLLTIWALGPERTNAAAVSMHCDGSVSSCRLVLPLRGLHPAVRWHPRRHARARLKRTPLSCLRNAVSLRRGAATTVIGASGRGAVCRLVFTENMQALSASPLLYQRITPTQSIVNMCGNDTGTHAVTIGQLGEVILWKARRLHEYTGSMSALAGHTITHPIDDTRFALSPGGGKIVISTSGNMTLLLYDDSKRRFVTYELAAPRHHCNAAADVTALCLTTDARSTEHLILVTVDGDILVYVLEKHALKQVYKIAVGVQVKLASINCNSVNGDIQLAVIDTTGGIKSFAGLLAGKDTMLTRDGHVETKHASVTHAAVATGNFVATVHEEDSARKLSIWNAQTSAYTSGLEHTHDCSSDEVVVSLQFVNTTNGLPALLFATSKQVSIISQRRLDVLSEESMWSTIGSWATTGGDISAAAYIWNCGIFVALASRNVVISNRLTDGASIDSCIAAANAPLHDCHPQNLTQHLLWSKVDTVHGVMMRMTSAGRSLLADDRLGAERVLTSEREMVSSETDTSDIRGGLDVMSQLTTRSTSSVSTTDEDLRCINALIDDSTLLPLPLLEKSYLRLVVKTIHEVQLQARALDVNGMRFLLALRTLAHAAKTKSTDLQVLPASRLRYRAVLWGFHSESQDMLIKSTEDVCGRPMLWEDAKALSLPIWIRSAEALAAQIETVARNEYMSKEDRDPTSCSLYYFALRKKRLVQGLWRQATHHKERQTMMKFLLNDFDEPRWKSAAMKNAYVLLSKQRPAYAAAFFMLADSLKDCVAVCLRQLGDFQLAIAIARIYEGDDGPVMKDILTNHVLPLAFAKGYRRLASWAFWMLKRRDMAVRVLVTSLPKLLEPAGLPSGLVVENPSQEDPGIVLLFEQLRSKTLQTLRGSQAISPIEETHFVVHMAQLLSRMGCQGLALDLLRDWEFRSAREQILALVQERTITKSVPSSRNGSAMDMRPHFGHRRRTSLVKPRRANTIILDVPSTVVSRAPSPERSSVPVAVNGQKEDTTGIKRVLKEVKAPPPEFDMSSFGF